jgi:hypothetical protein
MRTTCKDTAESQLSRLCLVLPLDLSCFTTTPSFFFLRLSSSSTSREATSLLQTVWPLPQVIVLRYLRQKNHSLSHCKEKSPRKFRTPLNAADLSGSETLSETLKYIPIHFRNSLCHLHLIQLDVQRSCALGSMWRRSKKKKRSAGSI